MKVGGAATTTTTIPTPATAVAAVNGMIGIGNCCFEPLLLLNLLLLATIQILNKDGSCFLFPLVE